MPRSDEHATVRSPSAHPSTGAAGRSGTHDATEVALLAMAFEGLRTSVALTIVVFAVFSSLFWRHLGHAEVVAWGAAVIGVAVARSVLWWSYGRDGERVARWRRWRRLFFVGAVAAGSSWSVGPVLLIPKSGAEQSLFMAIIVLGVGAVSMAALAPQWRALVGFLFAVLIPPAGALALAESDLVQVAAAALFAGFVSLVVVGRRSSASTRTLLESEARSAELDRLKTEFLGLASHELRTPMTGIFGFSELLAESPDVPEVERAWARSIHDESEKLRRIIEDLLDVSRIEAGRFDTDLQPVQLLTCVREASRVIATRAGSEHALTIEVDDSVAVIAQPQRLTQVLENLLGNACKYSPAGAQVTVAAECRGGEVRVSVSDRGLGIPTSAMDSLFERFRRVNAADRAQIRGTGLGLYIVKRYVDSFGGRVEVQSSEGVGSTFTVVLREAREAGRLAA